MKINVELEKVLFKYIRNNKEFFEKVKPEYFINSDISAAYTVTRKFWQRFSKIPSEEQVVGFLNNLNEGDTLQEKIDIPKIRAIFSVDIERYESEWIENVIIGWLQYKTLEASVIEANKLLNSQILTFDNISSVVEEYKRIIVSRNTLDFNNRKWLDFYDPHGHKQNLDDNRIPSGFHYLDTVMKGGFAKKTTTLFGAKPSGGKSLFLCNMALNIAKNGFNVGYITLEMPEDEIVRRLGCNAFSVKDSEYSEFANDVGNVAQKINQFTQGNSFIPGRIFVLEAPSNTLTPEDIIAKVDFLRDSTGVNLDALVIDYLGILKPPRYAINYNSYERYRSITVELNAIASMLNVANISAIQLKASTDDNSGQGKKFTDIADSTGIAQPAQYVFAIVQSDTDYLNRQYQIECMKARGSNKLVTGEFKVDYEHWRLIDTKRVRDIGAVSLDIEDEPTEVVSVQDLSLESFMENG